MFLTFPALWNTTLPLHKYVSLFCVNNKPHCRIKSCPLTLYVPVICSSKFCQTIKLERKNVRCAVLLNYNRNGAICSLEGLNIDWLLATVVENNKMSSVIHLSIISNISSCWLVTITAREIPIYLYVKWVHKNKHIPGLGRQWVAHIWSSADKFIFMCISSYKSHYGPFFSAYTPASWSFMEREEMWNVSTEIKHEENLSRRSYPLHELDINEIRNGIGLVENVTKIYVPLIFNTLVTKVLGMRRLSSVWIWKWLLVRLADS